MHATIAVRAGQTGAVVAAQLGHTPAVMYRSYVAPGSREASAAGRVLEILNPSATVPRKVGE